jgi:hypothetical protein
VWTEKPSSVRNSARISRITRSSSTTRMCAASPDSAVALVFDTVV